VPLLLEIFKTAKLTKFEPDPIELIKIKNASSLVYNHISNLNKQQILELQDRLELSDLYSEWLNLQDSQYTINNVIYYRRENGYFVNRFGKEQQLTNFTLTVRDRVKKDDTVFYVLEVVVAKKTAFIDLPSHVFNSAFKLQNYIREAVLNAGLDMPKFLSPEVDRRLKNFIFDYFKF
jgi:hypothetical protein